MRRVVWEPVLLFLSPFIAYAGLLLLRKSVPFSSQHWSRGTVSTLTLAELFAAALFLLTYRFLAERHESAYVPTPVEDERLVTGQFE